MKRPDNAKSSTTSPFWSFWCSLSFAKCSTHSIISLEIWVFPWNMIYLLHLETKFAGESCAQRFLLHLLFATGDAERIESSAHSADGAMWRLCLLTCPIDNGINKHRRQFMKIFDLARKSVPKLNRSHEFPNWNCLLNDNEMFWNEYHFHSLNWFFAVVALHR